MKSKGCFEISTIINLVQIYKKSIFFCKKVEILFVKSKKWSIFSSLHYFLLFRGIDFFRES